MSDKVLHAEAPLTDDERRLRWDHGTRIQVEHSSNRYVITSEWVVATREPNSPYGYAQKRSIERLATSKLDMTVPGTIDVAALTKAIINEIERQSERATIAGGSR